MPPNTPWDQEYAIEWVPSDPAVNQPGFFIEQLPSLNPNTLSNPQESVLKLPEDIDKIQARLDSLEAQVVNFNKIIEGLRMNIGKERFEQILKDIENESDTNR